MAWLDRSYLNHSPMDSVLTETHVETAAVGLTGTIARSAGVFARELTASVGLNATLTTIDALTRVLTASIGLAATASRQISVFRTFTTSVGLDATATRVRNLIRGITATPIGLAASLVQRRRTARGVSQVGTDRNVVTTTTDRNVSQSGNDRSNEVY